MVNFSSPCCGRKFLGLPDPDPLVRCTDPAQLRILPSSSKITTKTLIPSVLWLLCDFLSLKNDENFASKSNKQKTEGKKNKFLLPSWRSLTKIADSDPDPLVRGTDPRIRIRPKCHGSATLLAADLTRWKRIGTVERTKIIFREKHGPYQSSNQAKACLCPTKRISRMDWKKKFVSIFYKKHTQHFYIWIRSILL